MNKGFDCNGIFYSCLVSAKSGSDVSLNSLYDSTKSVLVVETRDRGQVRLVILRCTLRLGFSKYSNSI